MARINIGDVFEVLLPSKRKAFIQYVVKDKGLGPLVVAFNYFLAEGENLENLDVLQNIEILFPPVSVGILAPIRSGNWAKIGSMPIRQDLLDYAFVNAYYDTINQKRGLWYLYKRGESIPIGWDLPDKYADLELGLVWSAGDLEDRIDTGVNPHAYRFQLPSLRKM